MALKFHGLRCSKCHKPILTDLAKACPWCGNELELVFMDENAELKAWNKSQSCDG